MPTVSLNVATTQNDVGFMKIQTVNTPAGLVTVVAADAIFLNAPARPKQAFMTIADRQKRYTFSKMKRHGDRYGAGEVDVICYIKPSGSLGVRPHGYQLLRGLWGKETVVGATSVTYDPLPPGTAWPHYSLWLRDGHKVYALAGCEVKTAKIIGKADGSDDAVLAIQATIRFMRKFFVGSDELASLVATGAATITVKNAKKFYAGFYDASVGMLIKIGADDNVGAGYRITSVNTTTNAIGFNPVLAGAGEAADAIVTGFLPTPTDVGVAVNFYKGSTLHGAAGATSYVVLGADVDLTNPTKILEGEQNGTKYPGRSVVVGEWEGSLSLRLNMTEDETDSEYLAENQTAEIVKLSWGDTAASRMRLELPKVEFETPEEEGDEEIINVRTGIPLGSSGDDHVKCVFD